MSLGACLSAFVSVSVSVSVSVAVSVSVSVCLSVYLSVVCNDAFVFGDADSSAPSSSVPGSIAEMRRTRSYAML